MTLFFSQEYERKDKFFQIKIIKLVGENNNQVMIQITDSSSQILFDKQKQHNELLQTINATVNHEIRNPLNSINACNQ